MAASSAGERRCALTAQRTRDSMRNFRRVPRTVILSERHNLSRDDPVYWRTALRTARVVRQMRRN